MNLETRYNEPSGRLFAASNSVARSLVRLGAVPKGLHELQTIGRISGVLRRTPVNVLDLDGRRFLFSPRGHSQWVRNVRAGGAVALQRGRHVEPVRLVELNDVAKPEIIREYLAAWGWQVGALVDGLTATSADADIAARAAGFPVFEILAAE